MNLGDKQNILSAKQANQPICKGSEKGKCRPSHPQAVQRKSWVWDRVTEHQCKTQTKSNDWSERLDGSKICVVPNGSLLLSSC